MKNSFCMEALWRLKSENLFEHQEMEQILSFLTKGKEERHWDSQETRGSSCLAAIMIKIWSIETALTGTQTGHGILIRAQLTEVAVCTTMLKMKAPFNLEVMSLMQI